MSTDGYKAIMGLIRMQDADDAYGFAMANLFGLATAVYLYDGRILPDFEPSGLLTRESIASDGSWPDLQFLEMLDTGDAAPADVEAAYRVMAIYRNLIPEEDVY